MNKLLILILSFFIFVVTLNANQPIKKVKLQLEWKHQFEFAGFYAAKEKQSPLVFDYRLSETLELL